ncbi:MAG: DNA mismatch repair protein MutS [Spirochaetia bacterium]|nr:DNA mismatch repair protein MutS [Spirochaetia bacterium]
MPKRAKKKEARKEKAAGDSRLAVAPDAYLPFENIKEVKPTKVKPPVEKKPAVVERKEPLVLGYDPKANFGDILTAWEATGELGGVTKRMKSHSKVKVEKSFAEILAEWEGEKLAKQEAKSTEQTIKKSKAYVPKKDFGSLLDQFEGTAPAKPKAKQAEKRSLPSSPLTPSKEMEEALEEKEELDQERDSSVSWSFSDTYRQWTAQRDETSAIEKARKEKREHHKVQSTIGELRALEPQATLDLHGLKVLEAEKATADFLRSSKAENLQKVAIITGKGLHNDKGYSLLKEAALSQIRLSSVVREAYTPRAMHGGSGVIWVILKSS